MRLIIMRRSWRWSLLGQGPIQCLHVKPEKNDNVTCDEGLYLKELDFKNICSGCPHFYMSNVLASSSKWFSNVLINNVGHREGQTEMEPWLLDVIIHWYEYEWCGPLLCRTCPFPLLTHVCMYFALFLCDLIVGNFLAFRQIFRGGSPGHEPYKSTTRSAWLNPWLTVHYLV